MDDADQNIKNCCLEEALRVYKATGAVSVDPGSAE